MDGQRTGSAKKYLPYHNVLILHKSKKQTVKDQLNIYKIKFLLNMWKELSNFRLGNCIKKL